MAKKRLLAILLAVALMVSAFSLVLNVTASDVTPLSGDKFTGDGTVSLVDDVLNGADSNTYVRMYNVENYNATFPQFTNTAATIEAGAYYELHFFARTNSIVNDPGNRNHYLGRVYYGATTTNELYPSNTAIFSGSTSGSYITVGDEWEEFNIVFQVPASTEYTQPTITFRGSQVIAGYVPLEFDEMTLIKVDAKTLDTANKTYSTTGSYLLDCTSESSEDWVGEWSVAGTAAKAEIATVTETEFYRASASASGNTSVSYPDVTLDAGVYELSGDFRLSQIDGSKITVVSNYVTSDTNAAGLTLTAAGISADSTLSNEWGSSTVGFLLAEKTTLSDITLALDSALAFDYKNIVITKTADYEAPTPGYDSDWTASSEINVIDEVLDGAESNTYVRQYNRENYNATFLQCSDSANKLKQGSYYELSFMIRTNNIENSTSGNNVVWARVFRGAGHVGYPDYLITDAVDSGAVIIDADRSSSYLIGNNEWRKATIVFPVNTSNLSPADALDATFIFRGSGIHQGYVPLEIDELTLIEVNYDTATKTYTTTGDYILDCRSEDSSEWTGTWSISGDTDAADLSIETETVYNQVKASAENTTLTYPATTFEPGVYELAGDFRLNVVDCSKIPFVNSVFQANNNYADLTLTAAGVSEKTTISNEWTNASVEFTLAEKTTLSDIKAALDEALTLDFKNLEITKTADYEAPEIDDPTTNDGWTGNIEVIDDVLDADAETIGVADTNGYVHIYNVDGDSSIIYRESNETTLYRGNTYQLSVWLRTSALDCDDSVSEDSRYKDIEVHLGTKGNTCISQSMTNPNNSSLIEGTNIRQYVFGEFISLEGPKSTTGALRILPEWNKYTMTFEVTETCSELMLNQLFPIIFLSKSGAEDKIPFDLDGLSLKEVELNADTGKYDAVGDELIDPRMGTNSNVHWYTHGSQKIGVGAEVIYLTETEYKRVSANNDDTVTALEYVNDDVLTMGVYTVSGKFRLSAIDRADFVADTRVWTTDTLTLSLDSDAIIYEDGVNTATIGVDSWTDVTYTFTLTEETSLEGLTLALSDTAELDYKDLAITKIKDINANWNVNDVPAITVNDVLDGAETNEYIHVYDRISELDLVQYSDADVNLTAGAAYTLSVYMREGSIIEDRTADTTPVQIYYSAPTTDRLVTSDTVTDALNGDFEADLDAALVDDGWAKYTMTFTPIEDQTGLKIIFKILGNADFATTFDIDGLSLVSADGTELITDGEWETVVYAEDTGVKAVTLTESTYNRGVNETEDNTVLTYIDTDNEAGTYTVSGKVRLASRSTALVEYTLRQYRPDLWLSVVTNDNNKATLSVYAGDTLGDSAVITDEWSEITLTVTADSAFEALTLTLDSAYDLDFDDLTVVRAN